jgi:hypothetical protein
MRFAKKKNRFPAKMLECVEVFGLGLGSLRGRVSMKANNPPEKNLVLSESMEREIELYAFENSIVLAKISAEKKLEEAILKHEEVQAKYDDILQSRTWRYSYPLRRISHWVKSQFRSSAFGRFTLKIFKKIFG